MAMKSEFPAVTATLDAHASVPVELAWINFKKIAFTYTFAQKTHFCFQEMQYLSMVSILICNITLYLAYN